MANLSNINNKFIVTDGNNGRVLIGATNDIGATLFANHPSTTAPSLTFNAPAGQVFENEDLQIAFGLNNASPYNGYMQTRFVSAPYYRNLAINPLGGDVGIGTNSPGAKLQIQGNIKGGSASGSTWTDAKDDIGGLDVFVGSGSKALQVWDDNDQTNPRFVVERAGNVGIGDDTPTSKLTVSGPSNAASNTPSQAIVDIVGSSTAHLLMGTASVSPYGAWINTDATSQPLVLMGTGGNVGIGNANPQTNLTIGSAQGNSLEFTYDSTNGYRNIISNHWDSSTDTRMDFNIGRTGNVAPVLVMSVGYGGNVGIKTTSPQAQLHINEDTSNSYATLRLEGANRGGIIDMYNAAYPVSRIITDQSGNIGIHTSGAFASTTLTEKVSISTGGNVGIGITPNASYSNLQIKTPSSAYGLDLVGRDAGSNSESQITFWNSAQSSVLAAIYNSTSNLYFYTNGDNRMIINSSGYVAIPNDTGNYSGAASLIVTKKSSVPYVQYQYSGTSTSFRLEMDEYVTAGNVRQYFTQTNGGVSNGFSMTFNTGSVIFGDLEVASATQNSGSAFKKDSKARMTLCQASNSTALTDLQEYFNPNGAVGKIQTNGSATLFTTSSDYRLKEDLKSFSGLEMVSKIPVYDFKWKISDERSYGVMAHELQEVLPQAVGGDKDYEKDYVVKKAEYDDNHNLIKEAEYGKRPSYQTVDYSKIVPLLVKSIQELKAEIELLKSK